MRRLTIGELKRIIAEASDDTVVLTPGHDHSYEDAFAELSTALDGGRKGYTEDYGEGTTPEAEYGKRIPVLIVS